MSRNVIRIGVIAMLFSFVFFLHKPAFAHGHVEVGEYEIVIGFANEPAYQGDVNGIEFGVSNHETGEPVAGLEDSLKLEIIFGESRRELPVEAQWNNEGWYIGYVQPTMAGDYTTHIWGDIEGTPVDVTMTSSPDTFSSIASKAAIGFPAADPTVSDLQAKADAAAQTAQTALIVGVVGALLGIAGVVIGIRAKRA